MYIIWLKTVFVLLLISVTVSLAELEKEVFGIRSGLKALEAVSHQSFISTTKSILLRSALKLYSHSLLLLLLLVLVFSLLQHSLTDLFFC